MSWNSRSTSTRRALAARTALMQDGPPRSVAFANKQATHYLQRQLEMLELERRFHKRLSDMAILVRDMTFIQYIQYVDLSVYLTNRTH